MSGLEKRSVLDYLGISFMGKGTPELGTGLKRFLGLSLGLHGTGQGVPDGLEMLRHHLILYL